MMQSKPATWAEGLVSDPEFVTRLAADVDEADRCLLVLFTPRSGSSWLTGIASTTQQLGFLEEYLNPAFLRETAARMHATDGATLMRMLKRAAKTKNGVFSVEALAVHIELFGEDEFFEGIGNEAIVYFLWRDNIVAQGISLYRAVATGRYHSIDAPVPAPEYDGEEIAEWMRHIVEVENENLALLARRCLRARFLRYEDMVRDRITILNILADALHVSLTESQVAASERGELLKIADQWNQDAERRFREERREFVRALEARRLIRQGPEIATSGSKRPYTHRYPAGSATRWPFYGSWPCTADALRDRTCPDGSTALVFHSKFGGLWIDETDEGQIARKLTLIDNPVVREQVRKFARDGYVIIEQAVDPANIDAYLRDYEQGADTPGAFQMEVPTQGGRQDFCREKTRVPGAKVLDTAMLGRSGQDLCFAPKVAMFLEAVFDEKALAFQTLHFEVGSTQAIHQDTAYVVVKNEPLKLIASWTALQDVQAGSGELVYYIGGHRIPEYLYADGESKHWNIERDGHESHDGHLRYLKDRAGAGQLEEARFRPKKGDVLFWHADLPHGGSEITIPGLLRRSLVTHYCPKSLWPYYIDFIQKDRRAKVEARDGNGFVSMYFPPSRLAMGVRTDSD
jgi:LPS sulfotransferase NodH/ectoine hydroxylase-related dioxygenase (phytanoyl-CoA dioxygenase family)